MKVELIFHTHQKEIYRGSHISMAVAKIRDNWKKIVFLGFENKFHRFAFDDEESHELSENILDVLKNGTDAHERIYDLLAGYYYGVKPSAVIQAQLERNRFTQEIQEEFDKYLPGVHFEGAAIMPEELAYKGRPSAIIVASGVPKLEDRKRVMDSISGLPVAGKLGKIVVLFN